MYASQCPLGGWALTQRDLASAGLRCGLRSEALGAAITDERFA
jgi:hypothetical protein